MEAYTTWIYPVELQPALIGTLMNQLGFEEIEMVQRFLNTAHIVRPLNCWTTLFDGRNMVVTKALKFKVSNASFSYSCRSPSSPEASNCKDLRERSSHRLGIAGSTSTAAAAELPRQRVP